MKPQFVRSLEGPLLPAQRIIRFNTTDDNRVIAVVDDGDGTDTHTLAVCHDRLSAQNKEREIAHELVSGIAIANERYSEKYTFRQIMPAQPLWYAAYVWDADSKVTYLPLVGWALLAGSHEVVPLIFDDTLIDVSECWVERADEHCPSQYLGLIGPRTTRAAFEEARADRIRKIAAGNSALPGGDK